MRTLSLSYRQGIDAENDGSIIDVLLLTITHPLLAPPIRLSSGAVTRLQTDPELVYGIVSRGNDYVNVPFEYVLPEDGDDSVPSVRLRIANFSRDLIKLLRSTSTPAQVTAEVVSASDPDDVEITFPEFDLASMNYDETTIDISLIIDSLVRETIPSGSFTPKAFGGLF